MWNQELYNAFTAYSGYMHGSFNALVIIFFFYQGWLGWKIRQARVGNDSVFSLFAKRHRKLGPVLALSGIVGFLIGAAIVYVRNGQFLKHPVHFFVGFTLVFMIIATLSVSRKIKGARPPWRTVHATFGAVTLCLYLVQAYLGLSMIF